MKPWTERLRRHAPWIALPVVALVAFAIGILVAGDGKDGSAEPTEAAPEMADAHTTWTCSMHPQIRQDEPGQCPICGMDLIPASDDDDEAAGEPDPTRIVLSERAKVLARIRTAPVERLEEASAQRRLLGRIDYDETTLQTVTAWAGGRIDRLHVKATGERVRRGQPIATLYSPEIYQAHQDLISARRQAGAGIGGVVRGGAEATVQATRERLRLLGVPEQQLEEMEKADRPWRHIAIRSPFGGTIVERLATEGQYVETGSGLYRLAQLDRLWVLLDAYESDLPLLNEGQEVRLEVHAMPGEELTGTVAFIDPVLDPERRTARVRIEIRNRDRRLRPGMFAEAVVDAKPPRTDGNPLVIPASAPLFTGRRSLVYVEVPHAEQPTYEARVVRLGPRMDTVYPVVAGLRAGERVVEHGAFVLDADLQIRGGISMMTLPDDTEHGPYDDVVPIPAKLREALGRTLAPYLALQKALAADDLSAAEEASQALVESVRAFETEGAPEAARAWEPLAEHLRQHGSELARAESLEAARAAFRPLVEQVMRVLRVFGNPFDRPLHVAHCPMAFGGEGADWVQDREAIDNVYFGSEMRTCGEVRATVGPGEYLPGHDLTADTPAAPGGHQH
ncbi:MAG: efflux RND transporter periplasmic adaptor subunit [Myxococcota bacterium]